MRIVSREFNAFYRTHSKWWGVVTPSYISYFLDSFPSGILLDRRDPTLAISGNNFGFKYIEGNLR